MIRFVVPLVLMGTAAAAQEWSFQIDVANGEISETRSGTKQAEDALTGPYFSAETFAIVPSGPVPPCSEIESFEIDFFFGWSADSIVHVMTQIDDRNGTWVQDDPWLILSATSTDDILTDESADLVFDSISCLSDTQISVAMTVRANVVGETGTKPVELAARAIAPIYHIDQY